MSKVSPLAPQTYPTLPALDGVRLGAVEAGIKYKNRKDLAIIRFDRPASVAGVFTKSKCSSAPVDWCRKNLGGGKAGIVIVNSGNANAFTGKKGAASVRETAKAAKAVFGVPASQSFLASTGVIGEPLDVSGFEKHLEKARDLAEPGNWFEMAKAIMTTDTYPKLATRCFEVDGKSYSINGIAKGAGMIAPDMATMLSFIVTDFPLASDTLQKTLDRSIGDTFNSISVDSDTSTSDTVLLFSALNGRKPVTGNKGVAAFTGMLKELLHELALYVVCDGEGATKLVEITVSGAKSARSAKVIAMSIANSPLVKTAIAGEDANWGRVVMAVGKAGEPADRDRLRIQFGDICVAENGERSPGYDEAAASKVMKNSKIDIAVDLGIGKGQATVWTCDLTAEYIAINADYRS